MHGSVALVPKDTDGLLRYIQIISGPLQKVQMGEGSAEMPALLSRCCVWMPPEIKFLRYPRACGWSGPSGSRLQVVLSSLVVAAVSTPAGLWTPPMSWRLWLMVAQAVRRWASRSRCSTSCSGVLPGCISTPVSVTMQLGRVHAHPNSSRAVMRIAMGPGAASPGRMLCQKSAITPAMWGIAIWRQASRMALCWAT